MIETTVDGRYQVLARIAAGGMGEVYRAHDPVLNREIALKILHPSLAGDEGFIDRFRREARAAGMLSHPNIVGVHDWGQAGDVYFMVMEYIRGSNLRALLSRAGPLPPAQAAEIVSQVLAALGHAHVQGIVHRDVKPENVLITREGVVKVADFGLARALAESRVTHAPGTVTGTVQYLAPEQIQGEPADPKTDLYATGIVLYELLVGRVPFTGETSVAIAYKHLRERVPPPSRSNPMVPTSLDRVVASATEKDRARRAADAATLNRDLAAASSELPPAAPVSELAASVPASDQLPPDRAPTVTIPRALSPRVKRRAFLKRFLRNTAIVAALAAAGWAAWTYLVPHRTDTPRLGGLNVIAAQERAEQAGLQLVVRGREFSSDVDPGLIARQQPAAGSELERGDTLLVWLSKGPELKKVPAVVERPLRPARRLLEKAGFEVRTKRVFDDAIPEGRIAAQDPRARTLLEVGEPVVLSVSKGPRPVPVPNVVGRDGGDAQALLEDLDLRVSITEIFSNRIPRGDVIRQSPRPQTRVDPGTEVELVVSKGPRTFPMPDVIGMSRDAAKAKLTGLGLVVKVNQVPGSSGNEVVGQNPDGGETVRSGDTVTIFIGGS